MNLDDDEEENTDVVANVMMSPRLNAIGGASQAAVLNTSAPPPAINQDDGEGENIAQ